MHYRRFVLFVFAFLIISFVGSAQDVITVDKLTLDQHVERRYGPIYPPIAQAAHVMGTVVIEIRVGLTGKVESLKVVSGPPMLQQAAIDCLKQWTFHPFEKDGNPTPASGIVSIEFSLGKDGPTPREEEIARKYFKLSDLCRKAMLAKIDHSLTASVCKQAADTASKFAPDVRFIEKRSAFVSAAWAFMYHGDLKRDLTVGIRDWGVNGEALSYRGDLVTALTYADKAVEVVKLGHDDNSGSNAAFAVRGMVEANLVNLKAADQDLTIAEDFERKGIIWAQKEAIALLDDYRRELVQDLRFHAQVLQVLKRPDEAQKKLDEADQLMK